MEWQDISTAPKDGTEILIWARWDGEEDCSPEYSARVARQSGDTFISETSSPYCDYAVNPTKWAPLPSESPIKKEESDVIKQLRALPELPDDYEHPKRHHHYDKLLAELFALLKQVKDEDVHDFHAIVYERFNDAFILDPDWLGAVKSDLNGREFKLRLKELSIRAAELEMKANNPNHGVTFHRHET